MNSRQIFLAFLLLLIVQFGFSQSDRKTSIVFENVTHIDALLQLEKKIDFVFYFDEAWFGDTLISKTFTGATKEEIIYGILEDTPINYTIIDRNIILTKNNNIREELPLNYFSEDDTKTEVISEVTEDAITAPVLQKQYTTHYNELDSRVYSIGKENDQALKNKYTISGNVEDFNTGKGIENLSVYVKDKNVNTTTDANGYYSLELPSGFHILETSSLSHGKIQKQIIVYGDGTFSFDLNENLEQLEEVLIQSNRDENIKRVVSGVTKIDVESIKTIPLVLGERDILKVATTMPGVKSAGEGALGYNVRGGKADQNLILFDDAVIYNPSHFFGVFSAINPFISGNVEIYKGTIPSEFGGRLSSVIDISTKDINKNEFSGEGSIGPVTANLAIETPIVKGKSALMIGGRATYSDWILNQLKDKSIKNSNASFYDAALKYEHKINDNNNIQATAYFSKDEFSISSDSIYSYGNLIGSIKWDHKFNEKNSLETQFATSQYSYNILYDGAFNTNFDYGYTINESQLKLKAKYNLNKKHKIEYGLSSKLYKIQPGSIEPLGAESVIRQESIGKEKGLESALFISDLFEVNDKLSFDLGLRFSTYLSLGPKDQNYYDPSLPISEETITETKQYNNNEVIQTYGGPEFRFSGRYFLDDNLSLKAGYSTTIQYSHLLSTNTTASPVDSWKLSDPNLKPEKAQQVSIGLFKNFENSDYEISLESYYKKMKNLLDFKTGAELVLNNNIETELLTGEGKAYGVEFLLRKSLGRLNGWLGYSYSRTLIKLDSEFLTNQVNGGEYYAANQDRPHDLNLVTNYRITERYSVSFNFNYQSGRPVTYPIGKYEFTGTENVLYSDRNKFRVPDYFRLDVGLNIEGNHKNEKLAHSFINISIYNVLGRNNPYSVFFVNEGGQIEAYQSSIFSVPIPTITYNFKF
ncbi:TonB-dependent receptor [Formosa agariphila KMM 3901]|uniref:TonB-dependent receptor n=1 Tax=Formosa agariphila (strain DSM 15362 / KCTC 12365 / LMG 23005 / KMM 3901 / M-2Alg 35-1) TaxID=1347342 RepID=T2KLK8_FORAG|nr:TonB-dependent receptor [Formosa agariphila]CDF79323.1 TonB-dependent receptor [Formosa agariphila KMM 3901]